MSRPSWRDGSKKRPRSGRTDYGAKTTNQPKNYLQLPLELLEEEVRALPLLFTVFPLLCFTAGELFLASGRWTVVLLLVTVRPLGVVLTLRWVTLLWVGVRTTSFLVTVLLLPWGAWVRGLALLAVASPDLPTPPCLIPLLGISCLCAVAEGRFGVLSLCMWVVARPTLLPWVALVAERL